MMFLLKSERTDSIEMDLLHFFASFSAKVAVSLSKMQNKNMDSIFIIH